MTPTVLIASHARLEITKRNIESILRQSAQVVLVVTDEFERDCYKRHFSGKAIEVINYPNKPLGAKWQRGIEYVTHMKAGPLIITGSDDVLGDDFIKNACRLVEQGNHFIGLRRWWQHKEGRGYYCDYLAKNGQPIGGGRVYSDEMLRAINYQVFDITADKHLDDLGWNNARKTKLKCLILDEPEREGLSIHAIKGDWHVMNPFTIRHPNLKLLRIEQSIKVLPSFSWTK